MENTTTTTTNNNNNNNNNNDDDNDIYSQSLALEYLLYNANSDLIRLMTKELKYEEVIAIEGTLAGLVALIGSFELITNIEDDDKEFPLDLKFLWVIYQCLKQMYASDYEKVIENRPHSLNPALSPDSEQSQRNIAKALNLARELRRGKPLNPSSIPTFGIYYSAILKVKKRPDTPIHLSPLLGIFPYFYQLTGFLIAKGGEASQDEWRGLYKELCRVAFFESDFQTEAVEVIYSFVWNSINLAVKNWSSSKRKLYSIFFNSRYREISQIIPKDLEDVSKRTVQYADLRVPSPEYLDIMKRNCRTDIVGLCSTLFESVNSPVLDQVYQGVLSGQEKDYCFYPGSFFVKQ